MTHVPTVTVWVETSPGVDGWHALGSWLDAVHPAELFATIAVSASVARADAASIDGLRLRGIPVIELTAPAPATVAGRRRSRRDARFFLEAANGDSIAPWPPAERLPHAVEIARRELGVTLLAGCRREGCPLGGGPAARPTGRRCPSCRVPLDGRGSSPSGQGG